MPVKEMVVNVGMVVAMAMYVVVDLVVVGCTGGENSGGWLWVRLW